MDSTNKTTSNFCSNCGNKLNDGMLFCDKCGMKVGTDKSDLVSSSVNEKSKNGTKKSKPAKRIVLVVYSPFLYANYLIINIESSV